MCGQRATYFSTRTRQGLAALLIVMGVVATPLRGQATSERRTAGISLGAFYFNSGLRPGLVVEKPLPWNEGGGTALEVWGSLVPERGVGSGIGVSVGPGVLRGGLGVAAFRASGDFGFGPGLQVGFGVPLGRPNDPVRLYGSFHAYFTNQGYVPLLRLAIGPW